MISLRYFVLILLTLCARQVAGDQPQLGLWRAWLAIVGVTLGFALVSKLAAYRSILQSTTLGGTNFWQAIERFQARRMNIERIWCVALPAVLLATGWCSWTHRLQTEGWPESLLLATCFLPSIVFLLSMEITAAQVDALNKHDRMIDTCPTRTWLKSWSLRLRLGELAGVSTCLVPVFSLAAISDIGQFATERTGIDQAWIKMPMAIALVASFVAIFPLLLTRWSGGQPMPEILQSRIDNMAKPLKILGLRSVMIPSHGRWCGAAIVGWFPWLRRLWIGDAVIHTLTPRQLDMVILHELAHVRRMHFLWRAAPLVVAMFVGSAFWIGMSQLGLENSLLGTVAVGLVSGSTLIVGLGIVARYCELDADRVACELAEKTVPWSCGYSPSKELAGALSALIGSAESDQRATWLHPSLGQRLGQLALLDGATSP